MHRITSKLRSYRQFARDWTARLPRKPSPALDHSGPAEQYLDAVPQLQAKLAHAECRALDESRRAEGYQIVIGDLERKLATTQSHAVDEKNRAEGYARLIGELEAKLARADNRLAALRLGGPPEFPPLDQQTESLSRDLDRYLAAIPDRIELASYIARLGSSSAAGCESIRATISYLHFLLGDYDRAYKQLATIDLATLAGIIPNPRRTWHAFVWLLCRFDRRQAAAQLLDALARRGPADFEALQLSGASLGRQADARRRGVPAIFFNTTPKSGTVFLQQSLAHVLDAPIFRISLSGFAKDRVVPAMAEQFATGGAVCSHHIPATPENLKIMIQSGIRKTVVHVRDPRQCVTSLFLSQQHPWNADHTMPASGLNYGGEIQPPDDYQRMSSSERRSWIVTQYAPIYCRWIEDWLDASRNFDDLEITFVRYEDFVTDPSGYYTEVAKFFDLDTATVVPRLLEMQPKKDVLHYRKGRVDEWREVLSDSEGDLFRRLMQNRLFAEFRWQP